MILRVEGDGGLHQGGCSECENKWLGSACVLKERQNFLKNWRKGRRERGDLDHCRELAVSYFGKSVGAGVKNGELRSPVGDIGSWRCQEESFCLFGWLF